MATADQIDQFLRELEKSDAGHVFVVRAGSHTFVRKFVWISEGWVPCTDKECPGNGDSLYMVVENVGISDCRVQFRIRSEKGKVTLAGQGSDGHVVVQVYAPPRKSIRRTMPNEEKLKLGVTDASALTEIIHISSQDLRGSDLSKPEDGQIVVRFTE